MEEEFCQAMKADLGRDMFINYLMEIMLLESSLKHELDHVKDWMTHH